MRFVCIMKIIKWSAISLGFIVAFLGIMFLHFFIITEGDYKVEQTVEQNPSLPHTHIGTTALHTETYGCDTNEVVIVLHGGPGMDFRYLLPLQKLADEYKVVFYDQRGTGLSPRVGSGELTMNQMRSDLHQIVQTYSEGRTINLIGHSWGALLASVYSNAYPEKVNKVVLAEPWILPRGFDSGIRETVLCWFESLHINKPDKQASSDYFLYARLHGSQDSDQGQSEYWRYGSLARNNLLNDPLSQKEQPKLDYLNRYFTNSDQVLFIVGDEHSVPLEDYLIHPRDFTHEIRILAIEDTDHLFGEHKEVSINEIRNFLKE